MKDGEKDMETIVVIAAVAASAVISINPMQFGINPLQIL
jgi:hypothetical protein